MNKAMRVTAGAFGLVAGLAGIQHGFYELLQGSLRPDSLMIVSYGPPCQPEKVWHACEPAMTVIPSFFWAGILSMIVGLAVMIWAAAFVQRKYGGLVLALLSLLLLLVGGGIMPPIICFIGGLVGSRIHAPLRWSRAYLAGGTGRFLASAWAWSLGAFVVFVYGQYPFGYFFNDFLMNNGYLILIFVLGPFLLTIPAATAHSVRQGSRLQAAA